MTASRLDSAKFATLRRPRRIWTVAAIHGEADRLAALHDAIDARFEPGDRLAYLGNYLGHGPDIPATLDELLRFRRAILARPGMMACDIVFLRGAQEEMWAKLLQIHLAFSPAEVLEWMFERGVAATLEAYGGDPKSAMARARLSAVELARWTSELRNAMNAYPGHYVLMTVLRRAAVTDDGALLLVHAGVDPSRPLAAQSDTFWWGSGGFDAMTEPYGGFKLVVRGYDRAGKGFRVTPPTATIDGGCGSGGALHAACFAADGELIDHIEV